MSTATPAILAAIEAKAGVERRRLEDENGGAPPARLLEVVTDGPADAPRVAKKDLTLNARSDFRLTI